MYAQIMYVQTNQKEMSNSPNLALPHRRDVQFFQPTYAERLFVDCICLLSSDLPARKDFLFFLPLTRNRTSQEGINEGTWGLDRAALQHGQDDSDEERDGREDEHAVKANSHTHEYDE